MKLTIAFVFASLAVLTAKHHHRYLKTPDSLEDDLVDTEDSTQAVDLKGTLRRSFAPEAMMLNMQGNVICSPLSALLPLAKLLLGTDPGKSRDELLKAIGEKKSSVKRKFKELFQKLRYLPGVTLSIASRMFVGNNIELLPQYQKETNSVFHSTLHKLDFSNSHVSAKTVNDWVSSQTHGKIRDLVSPTDINKETSMMLVNAIYFSGQWVHPFKSVFVGDFFTPFGKRRIPMMRSQETYKFTKSKILDAKIIEIPYEGHKASFVIVLPRSNFGLPMLLSELKLAPELLNQEMLKMEPTRLHLTMPKFKIETELDLKTLYEKVGVQNVFTVDAGLNRISNTPLRLSKAVQKAYIEVSEIGTEAAAASSLIMQKLKLDSSIVVKVDHPFVFYVKIYQQQLFAGTFVVPDRTWN